MILLLDRSSITTGAGVPRGRARGIGGRGAPTCSPETTHEIAGGTHVGEKPLWFVAIRAVSHLCALNMFHGDCVIASAGLVNSFCWRSLNCTRPDMVPAPSAGSALKRLPGQNNRGSWANDCEPRRCLVTKMISSPAGGSSKIVRGVTPSPNPPGMLCRLSRRMNRNT